MFKPTGKMFALLTVILVAGMSLFRQVQACPFCGAVGATFSEEIELSDMAVFAKLKSLPPKSNKTAIQIDVSEVPRAIFFVDKVIKGDKLIQVNQEITAIYFGEAAVGTKFLIYGASVPKPEWSTPIELSKPLEDYLDQVISFPKDRGERAVRLQSYLTSSDAIIRQDAYNEFATTEYKDLRRVATQFNAQQIRESLNNLDGEESHLALNYTLLGIIGGPADVEMLEQRLRAKDDLQRKRLDALVGCYLTLKGPSGLEFIEQQFVQPYLAEEKFSQLYRVLLALRFHGDDGQVIKKEQIAPIFRQFLKYPKYADLVIPDLARWQDWSVVDQIMDLYKNKDESVQFVREPAVRYMRICTEPVAARYLEEMKIIDGDAYKRAMLFPLSTPKVNSAAQSPGTKDKSASEKTTTIDLTPNIKNDQQSKIPAPIVSP